MPVPGISQPRRSNRYGEPHIAHIYHFTEFLSVVALYDYEAQGDDELPLIAGERVELSAGENGGEMYGEGWWEGFNSHGKVGIFPSNYVRSSLSIALGLVC